MTTSRALAFLTLATAAAMAPAASAQVSSTLIYWRTTLTAPKPNHHFKYFVNLRTNARVNVYPNVSGNPSALAIYPNFTRQFFIDEHLNTDRVGPIPGTRKDKVLLRFMSERNPAETFAITNFDGPEWIDQADPRWSSNLRDSFFSFQAFNPRRPARKVYRFNGSKSVVFSPIFRPFVPDDPRLQVVTSFSADSFTNDWNSTGIRLMFSTPARFGFLTRIFDTQALTTTTVNDPAVSGFSLRSPVFSPTNPDIAYAIAETPGGLRGLASFNVMTQDFAFLLLEGGTGVNRITNFTGPQVSPDGRQLAFTMLRDVRIGTVTGPAVTLAFIPVTGGTPGFLFTVGHSRANTHEVTAWLSEF